MFRIYILDDCFAHNLKRKKVSSLITPGLGRAVVDQCFKLHNGATS